MRTAFARDPDLGNLYLPVLHRAISRPGAATRRAVDGEIGIFVAKQHRPIYDDMGRMLARQLLWASITHNERVDAGAAIQANRVFGTSGTTANGVFTVIAVANAALTKAKTDLSLGSATGGVTTNEFTTLGLARAVGTVGAYTLPGSLGGTFSQVISKVFTATGAATATGGGIFDSATVAGSNLYVEDNFASNAVLANNDSLTVTVTITN